MTAVTVSDELVPTTSVAAAVEAVMSNEKASTVVSATCELRRWLSIRHKPPIDEILGSGVVPRLIQFLWMTDSPCLQFESLWALTNICGSKHSAHPKATVDMGIIPPLIALVSSTNMDICSQAIWAVGNLCGDGHVIRDLVVDQGFLPALISAIERFSDKPPFLKTASWALANLCRAKPRPSVSLFMPTAGTSAGVFPTLIALFHSNNNDVISNAAWAISYLCRSHRFIDPILSAGLVPVLIHVLTIDDANVQVPTFKALHHIGAGNDAQTQALLEANVLQVCDHLLKSRKTVVRTATCFFLSNVAAGSSEQVRTLFNSGCLTTVIHNLKADKMKVRKEACWVVCNSIESGAPDITDHILSLGVWDSFFALGRKYPKMSTIILLACRKILSIHPGYLQGRSDILESLRTIAEHNDDLRLLFSAVVDEYGTETRPGPRSPPCSSQNMDAE